MCLLSLNKQAEIMASRKLVNRIITAEDLWFHLQAEHPWILEQEDLRLDQLSGVHDDYHSTDAPANETESERIYREEQSEGQWEDRY